MLHILLYVIGAVAMLLGVTTVAGAPAVTQEMAGILLILVSVTALGFAETIRLMQNAAEEIISAVKANGREPGEE